MSMLSLTMQSPANSKLSHGNSVREGSEISYTSPGTSSLEVMYRPVTGKHTPWLNRQSTDKTGSARLVHYSHIVTAPADVALSTDQRDTKVRRIELTERVSSNVVVMLATDMMKMQTA